MSSIPFDVLSSVIKEISNENTLPLLDLMLVSKPWRFLLTGSTSFWKDVKMENREASDYQRLALLQVATKLSNRSLNSICDLKEWRKEENSLNALFYLESSKATLKRIDLEMEFKDDHWASHISFFKKFSQLERLNLTGRVLPEIKARKPGSLCLLGVRVTEIYDEDEDGDILDHKDWIEDLQALHYYNWGAEAAMPLDLLALLEASGKNLIELDFHAGTEPPYSTRFYDLPNLEILKVGNAHCDEDIFDILKIPKGKAKQVHACPNLQLLDGMSNLEALRLQVYFREWEQEEIPDRLSRLLSLVGEHSNSLKVLELASSGDHVSYPAYSIDLLLSYLMPKIGLPVKCPGLLSLKLSKRQRYEPKILAVLSFSRRIDERCSNLELTLDESNIERFREGEQKAIEELPQDVRALAGLLCAVVHQGERSSRIGSEETINWIQW